MRDDINWKLVARVVIVALTLLVAIVTVVCINYLGANKGVLGNSVYFCVVAEIILGLYFTIK